MREHVTGPTVLDTPCRVWRGPYDGFGYGQWGKHRAVHRWVWEQINGPIPSGMCVLHHCDNPPCFRYDHLWLGTRADNYADMEAKGRSGFHQPQPGEQNGRARLTDRGG